MSSRPPAAAAGPRPPRAGGLRVEPLPAGRWQVGPVPLGDLVLTGLLLLASLPVLVRHVEGDRGPQAVRAVLVLVLVLPLTVRRRWPVPVFAIVAAAAFVQWLLLTVGSYDLAVLVALYTVAAYSGRRWSYPALTVALVGALLAWAHPAHNLLGLVPVVLAVLATWVLGDTLGARRAYLAALEDRAERLEREQQALARAAVAEERTRIAREMHDVVAHRVSVIVAQAEGAGHVVRADPARAEQALEVIADSGRDALTELRRLLGVLRTLDADDEPAQVRPQPGGGSLPAQLEALVADVRAAGLVVRLSVTGDLAGLDESVGLTVFRLVQEALTNTLKHAGPGARAELAVVRTRHTVRVAVTDVGPPDPERPVGALPSGGHGLVGMRERAVLLGGTFSAGPVGGGWQVRAELPLAAAP